MNRAKLIFNGIIASLLILMIGLGNVALATPLTGTNAHCLDHGSEMVMVDEANSSDFSICAIHLCSALIPNNSLTQNGEILKSSAIIHLGNDFHSLIHADSLHRPPNA